MGKRLLTNNLLQSTATDKAQAELKNANRNNWFSSTQFYTILSNSNQLSTLIFLFLPLGVDCNKTVHKKLLSYAP